MILLDLLILTICAAIPIYAILLHSQKEKEKEKESQLVDEWINQLIGQTSLKDIRNVYSSMDFQSLKYSKKEEILQQIFGNLRSRFLKDGIADEKQENILNHFLLVTEPSESIVSSVENCLKKNKILRSVLNHQEIPIKLPSVHYFKLEKDEIPIYYEDKIGLSEIRTKTSYSGGSVGYSVRISKGFTLRQSAFKGTPIQEDILHEIGESSVLITRKNIYLSGGIKSFKIPHSKLAFVHDYSNGVLIQRDAQTAKPLFIEGGSWFYYNLLQNL